MCVEGGFFQIQSQLIANIEAPSDVLVKNTKLVSSTSLDDNSTNDDEPEEEDNGFDNNDHCTDDTMTNQQAASDKDEDQKVTAECEPTECIADLISSSNICDEVSYV